MIGYDILDDEQNKKPDLFPFDYAKLINDLESLHANKQALEKIENLFKKTHDIDLLKDFMPKRTFQGVYLNENIEGTATVLNPAKTTPLKLKQYLQDIKEIFPEAKLHDVTTIKGEPRIACIGITPEEVSAALNLCNAKRKTEAMIARRTEALHTLTGQETAREVLTGGEKVSNISSHVAKLSGLSKEQEMSLV